MVKNKIEENNEKHSAIEFLEKLILRSFVLTEIARQLGCQIQFNNGGGNSLSTLISSCCLNAFKFPDLTKRCPTGSSAALVDGDTGYDSKITGISASNDETQTRCTNNANAPEESRKFNYLRGSRNFYRYSHRGCPLGANNHTDCGDESELTQFRLDFKFSTSLLYKTLT